MEDSLIVVFTKRYDETYQTYLAGLGLSNFSQEGCKVAAVTYPFGGNCVDQHASGDADILLVSDQEIDESMRNTLQVYIQNNNKIIVVYHKGARNNFRNDGGTGHKDVIEQLCDDKEICATEEHSDSGVAFKALKQVRVACDESEPEKYHSAVKQIFDFACGDPILEAKLDLLHKLLVPPAEDSGGWKEIEEDWSNLMELVEDDPEVNEHGEKYNQAWEEFIKQDPQQYSDDPFNEKYYGSEEEEGMLERLRDELLS